jgi:hypothetical protein
MKKIELYLSNEEWAFAQGLFQRLEYSYAVFEVESLRFSFSPIQEKEEGAESWTTLFKAKPEMDWTEEENEAIANNEY